MKYEFKISTYLKDQTGIDALNADGAKGWSVVMVIKETDTDYKMLMERRYE